MSRETRPRDPAAAGTIRITLNGEPTTIESQSLAELLDHLGHPPQSMATAVNGEFVARDARAARRLADGDRVTTFQRIVGG